MATTLPQDFKEFLALLNSGKVEYLVIGGYAVSYYGYPRPTGDLDIWVPIRSDTAAELVKLVEQFGFGSARAQADLFLRPGNVVRLGVPPIRIEIINRISGSQFHECFPRRVCATLDEIPVNLISYADLLANKEAAGRDKDRNDLKHLRRAGKG